MSDKIKQIKRNSWPAPPPVPRCCATCAFLTNDGLCVQLEEFPPVEFLNKENECPKYDVDVPF